MSVTDHKRHGVEQQAEGCDLTGQAIQGVEVTLDLKALQLGPDARKVNTRRRNRNSSRTSAPGSAVAPTAAPEPPAEFRTRPVMGC